MNNTDYRIGLWLIGAMGNISICVVSGLSAIKQSLVGEIGLVTALPVFESIALPAIDQIVVGGHDLKRGSVRECAKIFNQQTGTLPMELREAVKDDYDDYESKIRIGIDITDNRRPESTKHLIQIVEQLEEDINSFKNENALNDVVVINVASTESNSDDLSTDLNLDSLRMCIQNDEKSLVSNSILYAYAALNQKCAFVNFTPSLGSEIPALRELADSKVVPHAGKDGKTGETLVKSHLAKMFIFRNLEVLSWTGFNILGNSDGETLQDPMRKTAKINSKADSLKSIFEDVGSPHSHVGIDFVPSLGDWKIAWDHIHFKGWLECKMSLQFIWQGCDSMLAAPLIVDLARLSAFALKKRQKGVMCHLASFFKSPIDVKEHSFFEQHRLLINYVKKFSEE